MAKFILSDESINSYGFRVKTAGIDVEDFKKNPVMFYNHDSWRLPIGKWENIEVVDGKLQADAVFDMNDPEAVKIADKVNKGMLNACSIGFEVLALSEDAKDLAKGQIRPTVMKSRIFECSIVGLPANKNALKLKFTNGLRLSGDISDEVLNMQIPKIQTINMSQIALALGLPADATEAQMLQKINADKATLLSKEGNTENAIKALVALAEPKGFKKENIEKLAKADFETCLSMVLEREMPAAKAEDGKPDTTRLSDVLAAVKESGKNTPAGDEKANWTLSDYEQKDEKALRKLIAETPEKYQKLFKDAHGIDLKMEEIKNIKL